jgi:hypothetical protein
MILQYVLATATALLAPISLVVAFLGARQARKAAQELQPQVALLIEAELAKEPSLARVTPEERARSAREAARKVARELARKRVLMAARKRLSTPGTRLAGHSAWRITDLAAFLAGRKRPALREEWHAHLTRGTGCGLSARRKLVAALGFVMAAICCRLQDAAELAWIPIDAILKSRLLSNVIVWAPTMAATAVLFRHDGIDGTVGSAESIAAIGGMLYTLIRVGRWWRGIRPREPKIRRTKE